MGRHCLDLSNFKSDTMSVLCKHGLTPEGKVRWKCLCHCGKEFIATGTHIKAGNCQHCGCLKGIRISNGHKTHKMTGTKEHKAWSSLRSRCNNPSDKDYIRYGGRGISVCESWESSFESFFNDMGYAPTKKHSIDRIDVNGNYEPSNCRWATAKEQASNRRNNVYIDKESRTLLWERFGNLPIYQRTLWRIKNKGMSFADAIFQPPWTVK